jgi:hypothetical protein
MANIRDARRRRKAVGQKIYKGEAVVTERDEMMVIPFIQSGNKDEKRPWLYKGYYRMPDGAINMELKRMEGHMELSVETIENYKEYIGEAVDKFIKEVYKHSAHGAESISMEVHDTEIDLLKKELERVIGERDRAKAKVRSVIGMLDES